MEKDIINKLFKMLDEDDVICIANEFSMNSDDDLEFENSSAAMSYISRYTSTLLIDNDKSEDRFVECIGNLVAFRKIHQVFRDVEKDLHADIGINPMLGFEIEIHEAFLHPIYEEICSLFAKLQRPRAHEYIELLLEN